MTTKSIFLKYDKFGSFYRLSEGALECQPQMADPTLNNPTEGNWIEVDWCCGLEPEDLAEMKEIFSRLEAFNKARP